jgi:type I pantothenate kinase
MARIRLTAAGQSDLDPPSPRSLPSPFVSVDRSTWRQLRPAIPLGLGLGLGHDDLAALRGVNDPLSLNEVEEVYVPLARLLELHVTARRDLRHATAAFAGGPSEHVPYVVGIAGSVAVGKSTTARVLQKLIARWPDRPTVEVVTTDGFLYPNRELVARGLMNRKGFPESYDRRRLIRFLASIKSGQGEVVVPTYSHLAYDVIEGGYQVLRNPGIVIVEGINVLQTWGDGDRLPRLFISDFFDFGIYIDAAESDIARWYEERFMTLRATVFRDSQSYFHRYAGLDDDQAREQARTIWTEINGRNLRQNILPTRDRADLILHKDPDHRVDQLSIRKL